MKLRIRGNSIRLRLDRTEIARLGSEGRVEDRLSFGPGPELVYALEHRTQDAALAAAFDGVRVTVFISPDAAERLLKTEDVGIECDQPIDGDNNLRLLVEKDFACLTHRTGEDDSNAFDNPMAHCERE